MPRVGHHGLGQQGYRHSRGRNGKHAYAVGAEEVEAAAAKVPCPARGPCGKHHHRRLRQSRCPRHLAVDGQCQQPVDGLENRVGNRRCRGLEVRRQFDRASFRRYPDGVGARGVGGEVDSQARAARRYRQLPRRRVGIADYRSDEGWSAEAVHRRYPGRAVGHDNAHLPLPRHVVANLRDKGPGPVAAPRPARQPSPEAASAVFGRHGGGEGVRQRQQRLGTADAGARAAESFDEGLGRGRDVGNLRGVDGPLRGRPGGEGVVNHRYALAEAVEAANGAQQVGAADGVLASGQKNVCRSLHHRRPRPARHGDGGLPRHVAAVELRRGKYLDGRHAVAPRLGDVAAEGDAKPEPPRLHRATVVAVLGEGDVQRVGELAARGGGDTHRRRDVEHAAPFADEQTARHKGLHELAQGVEVGGEAAVGVDGGDGKVADGTGRDGGADYRALGGGQGDVGPVRSEAGHLVAAARPFEQPCPVAGHHRYRRPLGKGAQRQRRQRTRHAHARVAGLQLGLGVEPADGQVGGPVYQQALAIGNQGHPPLGRYHPRRPGHCEDFGAALGGSKVKTVSHTQLVAALSKVFQHNRL